MWIIKFIVFWFFVLLFFGIAFVLLIPSILTWRWEVFRQYDVVLFDWWGLLTDDPHL